MAFDNNSARGLQLAYLGPLVWDTPSVGHSFARYGDVLVAFVGTPSVAYTPEMSLDGVTYFPWVVYDKSGTELTTVTAAGIYRFTGCGYLRFSTGSGSVLTAFARS